MSEGSYRVLGINGSPRGDQGITDMVMRRFLKGAEADIQPDRREG